MQAHKVAQGTTEWLQLRSGIPTASQFDRIVTPGGAKSKSAEKYRLELLAERCMGHPITERVSFWMKRGSEMEADALLFYQMQRDIDTEPAGFVTNDAGDRGASPDRFVGPDGLMEIKCPSEGEHMSYLMQSGSHYDTYKVQVQGQLYICEREWTDVLSFHPELPMSLARIHRDDKFIRIIEDELDDFCEKLAKLVDDAQRKGYIATSETFDSVRHAEGRPPLGAPEKTVTDLLKESLIAVQDKH